MDSPLAPIAQRKALCGIGGKFHIGALYFERQQSRWLTSRSAIETAVAALHLLVGSRGEDPQAVAADQHDKDLDFS